MKNNLEDYNNAFLLVFIAYEKVVFVKYHIIVTSHGEALHLKELWFTYYICVVHLLYLYVGANYINKNIWRNNENYEQRNIMMDIFLN